MKKNTGIWRHSANKSRKRRVRQFTIVFWHRDN